MKSVKDTLLIALARYVAISDFKDVKKKFLNQGKEESAVDIVLDDFKELKKLQKIKDKEQKDIAYWGKQGFEKLKTFVDNLKATPSKSEEKKLKKMEGAEKVAENDKWGVYRITTHEASCYYGGGTKWCITEQNSSHFEDYIRKNNFYFLISKTRDSEDPLYKIALMVDKEGDRTYFDAEDKQIADIPASIREELPEFDPESAEGIDVMSLLPSEVSVDVEDVYDLGPHMDDIGESSGLSEEAEQALTDIMEHDDWKELMSNYISLSASPIEPDSYIGAFDKEVELLVEMYEGFDSDYEDSTSTDQSRIKQHIEEIVEEDLDAEDYDYTNVSFDGANNDDATLYATFTYYIEVDEDELIELAKDNKKVDYRSVLREIEKPIDKLSYEIDIEHEMDGNEYFTLTYKLNEDYPVENIIDDLPGNLKYLDEPEMIGDDLVFEVPYDPNDHKDLKEYKEGIMKEVMQVFNRLTAKKGIKLTKRR